MLSTLKGQVEFSTGKKIVFNHTFSKGMTTITGPNESGKSLRLEMIRYALFGTKALRSVATSYKSIDVTMEYKIGENSFKVVRTKAETKLYKDGAITSTGATPVNAAIIKSLGYNIEVFDVANACLQDDITAMTKKTPAERKRMIDKTLGIDALDVLIKETSEELSSEKARVSIIERQLSTLIVSIPQKPAGYETSASLENQMKTLISQQQLKAGLIAQLSAYHCELPVNSFTGNVPLEPIEVLLERQAQSRAAVISLSNIEKEIQAAEEATKKALTTEQVELYEGYLALGIYEQWGVYQNYIELKAEADSAVYNQFQLELLELGLQFSDTIEAIEQLKSSENITCPHCNGEFSLSQDHIDTLEKTLVPSSRAAYDYWVAEGTPYDKAIKDYWAKLAIKKSIVEVLKPSMEYIGTDTYVQSLLDMNKVYEERLAGLADLIVKKEQVQNQILPNIDQLVRERQLWDNFERSFNEANCRYSTYLQLKADIEPQITHYGNLDTQISNLFGLISVCKDYEIAFSNYQTMCVMEGQLLFSKLEAETKITRLSNIKTALSELKPKVKSYLVPSLSAVASNFLSKMTNNVRNRIDISDEFDITVDGQAVETLSGSGKSVANIAVRLALSTVLTNKIFSVFMADEIDAAMDADRAEFTASCLKELSSVFSQIILISHKKPEADNYIQL